MSPKNISFLLSSKVYLLITSIRNWLYDRGLLSIYQSTLPVVSIGNLSAGGNAKTPLCMFLAGELLKRGWRPVILTRGYKGSLAGPHIVKSEDTPELVGDEPVLMSSIQQCPVVVSRKRTDGAKLIEEEDLGDIIILDDGFQHRSLARTVDIISVNIGSGTAIEDFVQGRLLPYGRFRERRDAALKRAHIVVLSARQQLKPNQEAPAEMLKLFPEHLRLFKSGILPAGIKPLRDSDALSGDDLVAFAAIANPEGFFSTVKEMGFNLVEEKHFIDHYLFCREDLDVLRRKHPGVPLLCTEKDAVKIKPEWSENVFVLRIETKVVPTDAFIVQILKMIVGKE